MRRTKAQLMQPHKTEILKQVDAWHAWHKEQQYEFDSVRHKTDRNAAMVRDWINEGLSYDELASRYNLTRERLRQIIAKIKRWEPPPPQPAHYVSDPDPDDIAGLELSVRAANTLQRLGIQTVTQARALTAKDFLKVQNCGRKTVNDIARALARHSEKHCLTSQ
jgi:hypothetical protein